MSTQSHISELTTQVDLLLMEVKRLNARVLELEKENALLRSQLSQNSQNSHRPPSSDGMNRQASRKSGLPKSGPKKLGGQVGHKGKTLEMSSKVDQVEALLPPSHCRHCGTALSKESAQVLERRQVLDLPEPRLHVVEYQRYGCTCGQCGSEQSGVFPAEVGSRVQYGAGVRALATLLHQGYHLSLGSIEQLFADLYGYRVNRSTQLTAIDACYEHLADTEASIKARLKQSEVVHFDETGLGKHGHYLHTGCNQAYSYMFAHLKRGNLAIGGEESILPTYQGWAIHDCWSSYWIHKGAKHGLCGAHLLRELNGLIDNGSKWAKQMRAFLLKLYEQSDKGKSIIQRSRSKTLRVFHRILARAKKEEPPPVKKPGRGKPKATKGYNLMARMQKHAEAVLAFAFHPNVPFTNNLAERAIRPAKTKIKVSGGFRTHKGAQRFARIFGFIQTTRKQNKNTFKEIREFCKSKNQYPPPSWC